MGTEKGMCVSSRHCCESTSDWGDKELIVAGIARVVLTFGGMGDGEDESRRNLISATGAALVRNLALALARTKQVRTFEVEAVFEAVFSSFIRFQSRDEPADMSGLEREETQDG